MSWSTKVAKDVSQTSRRQYAGQILNFIYWYNCRDMKCHKWNVTVSIRRNKVACILRTCSSSCCLHILCHLCLSTQCEMWIIFWSCSLEYFISLYYHSAVYLSSMYSSFRFCLTHILLETSSIRKPWHMLYSIYFMWFERQEKWTSLKNIILYTEFMYCITLIGLQWIISIKRQGLLTRTIFLYFNGHVNKHCYILSYHFNR